VVDDASLVPRGPAECLVVEFAGTPRAGKSCTIQELGKHLRARGRRVQIVEERAGSWPHSTKRHPHYNLWSAAATSASLIEAMYADVDIALIDRGLFDALCWMEWYRRLGHLSAYDHRVVDRFLRIAPLRETIGMVIVMTVEPMVALRREWRTRPPGSGYGCGTVMNPSTLHDLNATIAATAERHRDEFNLQEIDTTNTSREQTLQLVARAVQSLVAAQPSPASAATRSIERRTDAVSRSP
jgi:thymidylate kinase